MTRLPNDPLQEELRLIAVAFKLLGSGWRAFEHAPSDSPAVEVSTPDGQDMLVAPIPKAEGGGWTAALYLGSNRRLGRPTHRLPDQKGHLIPKMVANWSEAYGAGQLVVLPAPPTTK